jgi:hypothetical protein
VSVSIAQREVDVEVFKVPRNLFEQSSLLLFDFDYAFVGIPVALGSQKPLLEEKWKVVCFCLWNKQALHEQVTIISMVGLKEYCMHVPGISHLD